MTKSRKIDLNKFDERLEALIEEAKELNIPRARLADLVQCRLGVKALRLARNEK